MLGFKARIDSGELPKSNFANIQDLLKLEHFNVDFMRGKSSAAARLTDFIININVYNDIVENVEPMHLHLQALEQANQATAELDTVTKLWLGNNYMGDAGKQAVQDAVKGQSGFQLHL
jgi:hypothetical protein